MNLLHVLAPGEVGGLERVVQALALGLVKRDHDVHVATILDRRAEHPMCPPLRGAGVTVHPIVVPPRAYRRERAEVESLCRSIAPDVVHTHGYRADVIDAPAARGLNIPTISTVHGFTGGGWKNRAYELIQRMALRQFNIVVAVARPQASELARFGVRAARIRVIPNAWCPDQEPLDAERARSTLGVPRDQFHLGWVGRLSWEKGADIFLDAIAQVKDLPVTISIFGDGTERPALEEKARQLGIHSRVSWWGTVPAAGRLFRGFDAFVISSRTEGTPIVLFEAMRSEVPIIATAVGGVPDVVSPGEALLVPPRDPATLADAIRTVYTCPDLATTRAVRARERLSQYDEDSWIERYQSLYLSLRVRTPIAEQVG
jgi:glycosyltransferase involved in cell wall biosynthesis